MLHEFVSSLATCVGNSALFIVSLNEWPLDFSGDAAIAPFIARITAVALLSKLLHHLPSVIIVVDRRIIIPTAAAAAAFRNVGGDSYVSLICLTLHEILRGNAPIFAFPTTTRY